MGHSHVDGVMREDRFHIWKGLIIFWRNSAQVFEMQAMETALAAADGVLGESGIDGCSQYPYLSLPLHCSRVSTLSPLPH